MFQIPQPTPTTLSATGTLAIAQMLTRIVGVTSAVAVSLTLDTGANCDAGIASGNLPNDSAFDWSLRNDGSVSGAITLLAGTGHTMVGVALIPILSGGLFRTRKTGANTFVTYRIV